jgi:hypothetical protein
MLGAFRLMILAPPVCINFMALNIGGEILRERVVWTHTMASAAFSKKENIK